VLEDNAIFNVLDRRLVDRRELRLDMPTPILDWQHQWTGITVEAFGVPGKIALFLEDEAKAADGFGTQEGDTVGLRITSDAGAPNTFYIPGCARIDADLKSRLDGAACLMFDGTVFTDDEMLTAGVGSKTGQRMGHLHMSGPDGSMASLSDIAIGRRIYVHINNTNPVLDERSPEAALVKDSGWDVGFDGMEVRL
jgi:pyrroloquinoline quinone biosynthesis protein B